MHQENINTLINSIRNDFKDVIDDLINIIELIKDDIEEIKLKNQEN